MNNYDSISSQNRQFGFLFAVIFFLASIYIFFKVQLFASLILFLISQVFFVLTLLNSRILTTLNRLWIKLGMFLGRFVSPIMLGIIFFGFITPFALLLRIFNRDELNLRTYKKTYWHKRKSNDHTSFENQF